jgi:hypothetical protein
MNSQSENRTDGTEIPIFKKFNSNIAKQRQTAMTTSTPKPSQHQTRS